MIKEERKSYIDLTKLIAIILIMISHCNILSKEANIFINSFYITIFFVCTGITFKKEKTTNLIILKKQIFKIIKYYMIFSLIDLVLFTGLQIVNGSFSTNNFITNLVGIFYSRYKFIITSDVILMGIGNSPLWFLTCYILSYSLFFIIRKKVNKDTTNFSLVILLFILAYLFSLIPILLPWSLDVVPYMTAFMLLGYLFEKYNVLKKVNNIRFIFLLLLDFVLLYYNYEINFSLKIYGLYPLTLLMSLIGCTCLLYLSKKIVSREIIKKYSELGKYTLEMLCCHLIVFFAIDTIVNFVIKSEYNIVIAWIICIFKILFSVILSIYVNKILKLKERSNI